ncbi:hypothetical protein QBC35DRAFT_494203 [Podospora australis]|uniref:Secreted protein n=1 Tax=Podospora australis TaxID=1536484 RepID=A0AAN6WVS9_9PEZI|nr:hypothetical protein QBC35DRAFT_494203 [Podospora australis]
MMCSWWLKGCAVVLLPGVNLSRFSTGQRCHQTIVVEGRSIRGSIYTVSVEPRSCITLILRGSFFPSSFCFFCPSHLYHPAYSSHVVGRLFSFSFFP